MTTAAWLLAWGSAWLTPWPAWLADWPRTKAAVGLTLLIAPGALVARALRGRGTLGQDLTVGLACSLALTGALGLTASLLRLPLGAVTAGLVAAGAAAIVCRPRASRAADRHATARRRWSAAVWVVPLGAAIAIAARFADVVDAGGDNFVYNAMIADALHGEHLSLADPVFGPERLAISRFWIAFWPLMLALIGRAAGLEALPFAAAHVNPLLAGIAVLATFELARALGFSRALAALAAVLQVAALLLLTAPHQPGTVFFTRLREDKVFAAFVLAPTWFRLIADALRTPSRRAAVLAFTGGAGLLFARATVLAVAAAIAAAWIGLAALAGASLGAALPVATAAAVLIAVPLAIRLGADLIGGAGAAHAMYFDVAAARQAGADYILRAPRLDLLDGDRYRVRLSLLGGAAGGVWLALAFAAAALGLRAHQAARYVAAAAAVTAAVLCAPTAALLGLAITPFHLWRVLWLAPYGIATAWMVATARRDLTPPDRPILQRLGMPLRTAAAVLLELLVLGGAAAVVPSGQWWRGQVDDAHHRAHTRRGDRLACVPSFTELRALGARLDAGAGAALAIGDPSANDLLAAASGRTRLVVFRTPEYMTELRIADREQRWRRYRAALDSAAPAPDRLRAIRESGATHLVACAAADRFAALAQAEPDAVHRIATLESLVLYAVRW